METLNENAIAGLLHEIFQEEMTAATATCATCGAAAPVADGVVYPRLPGEVVRCRTCGGLLMAFTRILGVHCVDLPGDSRAGSPRRPVN